MLQLDAPAWLAVLPLPALVAWLAPPWRTRIEAVRAPFFDTLVRLTGQEPTEGAVVLTRRIGAYVALAVAWTGVVLALAQPVWRGEPRTESRSARDLLLAVDLSGSMEIEDFQGADGATVSRLAGVQQVLDGFVARREGDRLGLIVFGTSPFVQVPFTEDTALVRSLLDDSTVGMAGEQTALGDAIGLAMKLFERSDASNRVVVALTDGNDTGSLVPPGQAARLAADAGITVYVVGVGDPRAAGEDRLNEDVLKRVAEITGGRYFFAQDGAGLEAIYAELDRREPVEFESRTWQPEEAVFHWPLGVSTVIGLLAVVLSSAGARRVLS